MSRIAFIGLGNMGGGMAANLVKAGHDVAAFDLSEDALLRAEAHGAARAASAQEAVRGAETVITMLPAGKHVREVFEGSVIGTAPKSAILIDCSTIDVATAREEIGKAQAADYEMVDAPVSGGIAAADAGTLTFMVGGTDAAFGRALPVLEKMGKTIVHAGGAGNGQAAKICNNMILGVSMIAVSEAFVLAEKLGLDAQKLYDISSKSSGQCWSMTTYCPVPGLVPTSPANRDYKAGFTAAMMLKDLRLAQDAAKAAGAETPLGADAAKIYSEFVETGEGPRDFSGVIRFIRGG